MAPVAPVAVLVLDALSVTVFPVIEAPLAKVMSLFVVPVPVSVSVPPAVIVFCTLIADPVIDTAPLLKFICPKEPPWEAKLKVPEPVAAIEVAPDE